MTGALICWAQALDNSSPDHLEIDGVEVSLDAPARRQEAVSTVSRVVKTGSKIFERRGVSLIAVHGRYVLEVPSEQHDHVGRTAPIVCCGAHPMPFDDSLPARVVSGIEGFASRIGRSVAAEHIQSARSAFDELKKKESSNRNLALGVALTATGLFIALVLYALIFRGW